MRWTVWSVNHFGKSIPNGVEVPLYVLFRKQSIDVDPGSTIVCDDDGITFANLELNRAGHTFVMSTIAKSFQNYNTKKPRVVSGIA
jgi:hypothetical protein